MIHNVGMEDLELENKIVKIYVDKLPSSGIKEIEITIKDLTNLKLIDDLDEPAPIAWIVDCLNENDKRDAVMYLLKKVNVI